MREAQEHYRYSTYSIRSDWLKALTIKKRTGRTRISSKCGANMSFSPCWAPFKPSVLFLTVFWNLLPYVTKHQVPVLTLLISFDQFFFPGEHEWPQHLIFQSQVHTPKVIVTFKNFVIKGVCPRDHLFPNECGKDYFHTIFIAWKFLENLGIKFSTINWHLQMKVQDELEVF